MAPREVGARLFQPLAEGAIDFDRPEEPPHGSREFEVAILRDPLQAGFRRRSELFQFEVGALADPDVVRPKLFDERVGILLEPGTQEDDREEGEFFHVCTI